MEITRINTYSDPRFSRVALMQHGCYLADGKPYEVEIVAPREAIIRGPSPEAYPAIAEEFRFYAPEVCRFFSESGACAAAFPEDPLLELSLDQIQPSQFYVDEEKLRAVGSFLHRPENVIVQVLPYEGRYLALDGHTRLFYAARQGWATVLALIQSSDEYIFSFSQEARKRGIRVPADLVLLSHEEYREKWDGYCNAFFAGRE